MDLTAWFGSQGVFSTGEAAHIFGSGSVPLTGPRIASAGYLYQPLAPLDIASSGCLAACYGLTAPLGFAWLPLGTLPDSRVPST
jgi:hypothetical protein